MDRKESGFSLVEVMVAATVLIAISAATSKMLTGQFSANTAVQVIADLNQIVRSLNEVVRIPSGLVPSADLADATGTPLNPTLKACFQAGMDEDAATLCNQPTQSRIWLVNPANVAERLAGPGTGSSRVYLTTGGVRCSGSDTQCPVMRYPLESLASFQGNATGVIISYCLRVRSKAAQTIASVRPLITSPTQTLTAVDKDFPSCRAFYGSDAEVVEMPPVRPHSRQYIPVASPVAFQAVRSCKPTEVVVGIRSDGTPKCAVAPKQTPDANADGKCVPGSFVKSLSADGTPVCESPLQVLQNFSCPKGTVLQGFDSSSRPTCSAPISTSIVLTADQLTKFHPNCTQATQHIWAGAAFAPTSYCFAAVNRYCRDKGYTSGIASEWNAGNVMVNCFGHIQ